MPRPVADDFSLLASASAEAPDGVASQVGGTLAVSGDREGTFTLSHETTEGQYGLAGDDGRIAFGGDPLAVTQVSFDGLSFFPEPDECTITPGQLNSTIGVATAHLRCTDLADIRGTGMITLDGKIGLAADLLGMRGELPLMGGTIDVGDETLAFGEAWLYTGHSPGRGSLPLFGMELHDADDDTRLTFDYESRTHGLVLETVERDGQESEVPDGACMITTRDIGVLNPRVTVIELSLKCAEVDVSGLGPVTIDGSVIVEQVAPSR